jgi:hypothetical protein
VWNYSIPYRNMKQTEKFCTMCSICSGELKRGDLVEKGWFVEKRGWLLEKKVRWLLAKKATWEKGLFVGKRGAF